MDWVPIPNRMDGEGYTELLEHANGPAHFAAWIAIVEISSRREVRGTFPQAGAEILQALARMSRIPAAIFEEAIPRLLKIGWIERLTEIPQAGAEIPQAGAAPSRDTRAVTEGNGTERKGMEQEEIGDIVAGCFDRHEKRNSRETRDLVVPMVMAMDLDFGKMLERHADLEEHWRGQWQFNQESFLAWVRSGMLVPRPKASGKKDAAQELTDLAVKQLKKGTF